MRSSLKYLTQQLSSRNIRRYVHMYLKFSLEDKPDSWEI
jgi:hypothetical protein